MKDARKHLLLADVDRLIERGWAARGKLLWLEPIARSSGFRWIDGSVLADSDGNRYDMVDPYEQSDVRLALLDGVLQAPPARIASVMRQRAKLLGDLGLDDWDTLDVP